MEMPFIFSTAYLVQSHCGRVAILCYRGTEPATLGNWLGDAEIGQDRHRLAQQTGLRVLRVNVEILGCHGGELRSGGDRSVRPGT